MTAKTNETELWDAIDREFGTNAIYVGEILQRYVSDPNSVDPEWREYFEELRVASAPAPASQAAPTPQPAQQQATAVQPAPAQQPAVQPAPPAPDANRVAIKGPALKIVENMETSLTVPTATSLRQLPLRVLDENRALINKHLQTTGGGKVSYTHLIAWALIRALDDYPQLNDGYEDVDGQSYRVVRPDVNLGVAVDVTKKDGTRTLLVPNVKGANHKTFSEFVAAYDDVVKRSRTGKIQVSDFQGTTISLTNPGTIGTHASTPRLMAGQGLIFATGAIGYPPGYEAVDPEALSQLGISKIITVTSTYDHRVIQGAESGAFLQRVHELVLGKDGFYEAIFADLGIPIQPLHWTTDTKSVLFGPDRRLEEIKKQAQVLSLINMFRVRGHLFANLDPLKMKNTLHHPELEMEQYGLTVWDLDRVFVTGGLGGVESAPLREIMSMLWRFYCGSVGYEYRHISSPE